MELNYIKRLFFAGATTQEEIGKYVAQKLKRKELKFAIEDPDNKTTSRATYSYGVRI